MSRALDIYKWTSLILAKTMEYARHSRRIWASTLNSPTKESSVFYKLLYFHIVFLCLKRMTEVKFLLRFK